MDVYKVISRFAHFQKIFKSWRVPMKWSSIPDAELNFDSNSCSTLLTKTHTKLKKLKVYYGNIQTITCPDKIKTCPR